MANQTIYNILVFHKNYTIRSMNTQQKAKLALKSFRDALTKAEYEQIDDLWINLVECRDNIVRRKNNLPSVQEEEETMCALLAAICARVGRGK